MKVGIARQHVALWLAAVIAAVICSWSLALSHAHAEYEVTEFTLDTLDSAEAPHVQAGGHPFVSRTRFSVGGDGTPAGQHGVSKDIVVELPPGSLGYLNRFPTCSVLEMISFPPDRMCGAEAQIGSINPIVSQLGQPYISMGQLPIYNLEPQPGEAARFGFSIAGNPIVMAATIRPADYGVTITTPDISTMYQMQSFELDLWGVPADPAHDARRVCFPTFGCPSPLAPQPLLSNPTSCGAVQRSLLKTRSWQEQDAWVTRTHEAPEMEGCGDLQFEPSVSMALTSGRAASPAGMDVTIRMGEGDSPNGRVSAHLKDVEVALPEGVRVNPSGVRGLAACSEEQVGLGKAHSPGCPEASKIGRVELESPALDGLLEGGVYLAEQEANPFGSLLALYVVMANEERGVEVKLAGELATDPSTGQITARFPDNPQLPFSRFQMTLKDGPRAPLVTPDACGSFDAHTRLVGWNGAERTAVSTLSVTAGPDGRGCAGAGFEPDFSAGSSDPFAGSYSPFVARIARGDGGPAVTGLAMELPRGLLAKLAGVPYCAEKALRGFRASANTGIGTAAAELAAPACPASEVGRVEVSAGAGPTPFHLETGRVYLSGPYKGAPLSLTVIVPVKAGPFDLGTVMVRNALQVDPRTAEVSVVSDAFPTMIEGVPLLIRDLRVAIDRDGFTVNPTSCAEQRVAGVVAGLDGSRTVRSSRFQVGDCAALAFAPRLGLALKGRRQARTGGHPAVRAVVRQPVGKVAGIRRARVVLPGSLALDPDNARALCEYVDGTKPDLENRCPRGSIVGRARARTPLLDDDLVGDVFFVKNVRRDRETGNEIRTLPMLVVALRGQIDINLVGKSSTTRNGRLVSTFAGVPDAPIRRFNLNVRGGNAGILAVTANRRGDIDLCDRPRGHLATTAMVGHNGKRSRFRTRVKAPCATRAAGSRRGR